MRLVQVPRSRVGAEAWDRFVEGHPFGWFFHSSRWIDYALAYTPGAVDKSVALYDEQLLDIMAVIPGVVDASGAPVFGGQRHPAPLLSELIEDLQTDLGGHPTLTVTWRPGQPVIGTVQSGFRIRETRTFVVDLEQPQDTLWKRVRKGYRQAIRKCEASVYAWAGDAQVGIPPLMAREVTRLAQALHLKAAGRVTRPGGTWERQAEWLADGDAVLALATRDGEQVGFTYTIRWKDWAYYASGASSVPDVSHALIWQTMLALKADGRTRWFEVGEDVSFADDEKARGIAFFKSGFGGDRMPVSILEPAGGTQ